MLKQIRTNLYKKWDIVKKPGFVSTEGESERAQASEICLNLVLWMRAKNVSESK